MACLNANYIQLHADDSFLIARSEIQKKDWVLVYILLHLIKNITQPPKISLKN